MADGTIGLGGLINKVFVASTVIQLFIVWVIYIILV